jgi:hypothetical protein
MGFSSPYDYKPKTHSSSILLKSHRKYSTLAVSFLSSDGNAEPSMGNVIGICYLPKSSSKLPFVIMVHGIGDSSTIPCHALAKALIPHGIGSFVIYLPIHSRRLPKAMKDRFYQLSLEEWFELYRISVINIRQVVDWAETRPEIDISRIGIAGVSFGGYVSGIALGLDKRLKSGAMLVACGNQEKVGYTRSTKRIPRWNVTEEVYREAQRSYLAYVNEVSARGFENVQPLKSSYFFDPYTFSPRIKEKPVFLANALWDEYFPREAAKDFWQACGRPEQLWLPSGHATAWLFYPLIRNKVLKLFKQAFSK